MGHTHTLRRFAGKAVEPSRSHGLSKTHSAVMNGHTIFQKSVVDPEDSPRLFVSGHNNPKLGKQILKGPMAGFPIYQLTLEERATCPESCHMWSDCYGNAMPFARRHDASNPQDLIRALHAELGQMQAAHAGGFMIRLHTLGDFFSVEYVEFWELALRHFPALHCFGYTSNWYGSPNEDERAIGRAILSLTRTEWDRFAIRFSLEASVEQSAVVRDTKSDHPNVIMCPAQTKDSECCATCGLCWAPALRKRSIGFLRHGMKKRGPAR